MGYEDFLSVHLGLQELFLQPFIGSVPHSFRPIRQRLIATWTPTEALSDLIGSLASTI